MAVAEDMVQAEGSEAAGQFLTEELARRPSLRGLARLISLQLETSNDKEREDLGLLQVLVNRLIAERPLYRCTHCGFSGRHLHWSCPGCKHWGTVKSIRGSAAE
jgi:lipopolysaccharide biosynthesis regulator YciM